MVRLHSVIAAILVLAVAASGASAGTLFDTLDKGPKIGDRIPPSFHAVDQTGKSRDFDSLAGPKGLILLFYRPLLLSPSCERQTAVWNDHLDDFRRLGYNVAAVTNDTVETQVEISRRRHLAFPLLSDPHSRIIRAFGLVDEKFEKGSAWYGGSVPIVFVADDGGVIRHRFSSTNFNDRPDIDAILKLLRGEASG